MKVLVTGSKGFVGKNLIATLKTKESFDIFEYDIDTDQALLAEYCQKADFVFHLAGVNRPKNQEEFMEGNFGFASILLDTLKKYKNTCPVMLSSSIQATMLGLNTESQSLQGKNYFSIMPKKQGQECLFIVSQIFLESGVVQIIILQLLLSVMRLPMIWNLQ